MKRQLVSVVVPTLNRPHLLGHALLSIAGQQTDVCQIEVIVVNDGGTDVAVPVDVARERGLAVNVINLAWRRGLPTARNIGIETARGEFLAFLDDDDVFLPGHLDAALNALGCGAEVAYTNCLVSTHRVDPADPPALPEAPSYPFDPDLLTVANFIPVHSAVVRRLPADARFDPALPALEDWDMWLRLNREHGYRFVQVPRTSVVYHRVPDQASMCGSAVNNGAALAEFGQLTEQLWRRWGPPNARVAHFRLYMAVMYWQCLAQLALGQPIPDLYFQRWVEHIAAAWYGTCNEDDLVHRIITSIKDETHAASTA